MTTSTQVFGGEVSGGGAAHRSECQDDSWEELHCCYYADVVN